MGNVVQDLRYGMRRLLGSPDFTAVAVLTLALGIGVNTSIFSLVNAVLLRPLPVKEPERLVSLYGRNVDLPVFSYPESVDYRDRNEVFSGLLAYRFVPINLSRNGRSDRIWGYLVSGNYFAVLGVKTALGRTFSPEEDRAPGAHPVAVVSYRCWQRLFGSDPKLIGKSLTLNGHRFTVVGVAPKGFRGTELYFSPDIWVPMMMTAEIGLGTNWLNQRGNRGLFLLGRLKSGISVAQAEASLSILAHQLAEQYPEMNEEQNITLGPPGLFSPALRHQVINFSVVLLMVVGLVLVLTCVNLANLLLAHAAERRREIAIRLALGAGRWRLIQQLLTESLSLSLVGGGLGALLALWINDLAAALRPPTDFPLTIDLPMDVRVFTFALLISLLTVVLFGLVPALQATKPDLVPALKNGASVAGSRRSQLRSGLMVTQVALSLVLLIAAGLTVRSLQHAQSLNPGFDPQNVVMLSLDVGLQGYDRAKGRQFYEQLVDHVAALPGVKAVSLTNTVPLGIDRSFMSIFVEGQPVARGEHVPRALYAVVGLSYFRARGIRLVSGRDFSPRDKDGSAPVVIVNETFARRFWPAPRAVINAVGKRISFSSPQGPFLQVIGVARDGKYLSLGESRRRFIYLPLLQHYTFPITLLVRTASEPRAAVAAIGREVLKLDEHLPLYDVKMLTDHLGLSLFPVRVATMLLGSFGVLALVLAVIGLYGVVAYTVAQRTHEIGIRLALGAQRKDVLRLVVRQGMALTLIGVAIGLVGAVALTRLMSSLLFGVSATDLVTFVGVTLLLTAVAPPACYLPARRAARVDPMAALRYE